MVKAGNGSFSFQELIRDAKFRKGAVLSGMEPRTSSSRIVKWGGFTDDTALVTGNSLEQMKELILNSLMLTNRINLDNADDEAIRRIDEIIRYQGKFAVKSQNNTDEVISMNPSWVKIKMTDFPATEDSVAEGLKVSLLDNEGQIVAEKGMKLTRTFSTDLTKKESKLVNRGKLSVEKLSSEKMFLTRYYQIS